ncbi:MAG: hypothetical protein ACOYEJ_10220, partial [Mahellales bacterium]|jgi:hypothetical protein
LVVVELGLCEFFYKTFLPLIETAETFELSGIQKFILSYFESDKSLPIEKIYLSYPKAITVISLIKYSLISISIVIFLVCLYNKIIKNTSGVKYLDLVLLAFFLMICVYSLMRLYIGGIVVTLFFWPGMFSILWLFNHSNRLKSWSIIVVICLLVLSPLYYCENMRHNLINKDDSKFISIDMPAEWCLEHLNFSSKPILESDELTKNFCLLYLSENNISYENAKKYFKIMPVSDALSLVESNNHIVGNKYFIINYKLNAMSLQNWTIIKPWEYSRNSINRNFQMHNIYDDGDIGIFKRNLF